MMVRLAVVMMLWREDRFRPLAYALEGEDRVNLGPRSCYEKGKRFGEALCKAYGDEYGVDVRIGRMFNSYGPRLRAEGLYGRVVSRFMLQALSGKDLTVYSDGTQTRSFCYVSDTVTGLLLQMGRNGPGREALNIGSEEEVRIVDLARKMIEMSGSNSRVRFTEFPEGDNKRRLPDTGKAKKVIGWEARVDFGDGLHQTLRWTKQRG